MLYAIHRLSNNVHEVIEKGVFFYLRDFQGNERRISDSSLRERYRLEESPIPGKTKGLISEDLEREISLRTKKPIWVRIPGYPEKENRTKKTESSHKEVSLKEICQELKIETSQARRKLRKAGETSYQGKWAWAVEEVERIREILKN